VYRRKLNTPKNGKKREGAISDGTRTLLNEWADLAEDPSAEGFVFPSERISTPLSLDNVWRRSMQPKLERFGLGWASFQVLRKTNATLSKKGRCRSESCLRSEGPRNRRQSGMYTSPDLAQKRAALQKLEAAVLRKPQPESQAALTNLA
jgi:hypothetical protein